MGTAATLVAVVCAVLATILTVRREFFPVPISRSSTHRQQQQFVKDWATYAMSGHRFGPITAPVTIVEFSDFQCPYCAKFETGALRAIRMRYPEDVAVVFHHWPLPYHRLAYSTARAAECAGVQGRFEAFHDLVFELQDSLGIMTPEEFALKSGVHDMEAFRACDAETAPVPAIEADVKAAVQIGARATPTFLVNGMLMRGAVETAALDSIVRAARATANKSRL